MEIAPTYPKGKNAAEDPKRTANPEHPIQLVSSFKSIASKVAAPTSALKKLDMMKNMENCRGMCEQCAEFIPLKMLFF